jgi:hypothetical protein
VLHWFPPLPGYRPATSWAHYTTSCKHSLVLLKMAVPPLPSYRPATSWVHYTTSCKHSLVLLKMGEIIARNMLSWLELLKKPLLLHLVGCLHY